MYLNATLFAQIAVFIVLVLFTMKFVWPPIMQALDDRATKISEGLAAAERGQQTLNSATARSADVLREGKGKVAELVAQGERRAQQIIEDAKAQAELDAEKIILAAKAEIEQEAARTKELLRARVADLALAGAEKILRREVDAKAHTEMLLAIQQEL